jgi:transposase-like protein
MTHRTNHNQTKPDSQRQREDWTDAGGWQQALSILIDEGFEGLAEAMKVLLNEAMKLERTMTLGARPYERSAERRGYANGFKPKTINTRVGALKLEVPQVRGTEFYPSVLERGQRSERALALAVAEMYLQGVSTRKVTAVMQELCGLEVTSMQVSRAVQKLDEELTQWRERPLGEIPYLFVDARYENVRVGGVVKSCALLIALGITPDGRRTVLGVSVSLSEAEVHWREFFASLQQRGLHGVQLIVSDDHAGLKEALRARFPGVGWQRCQYHLGQNLLDHLPPSVSQPEASAELRAVFNAPNRTEADRLLALMVEKYEPTAPKLAAWLESNVPEGLTVMAFPEKQRRRLRTNNAVERLNREVKRRTRVATMFPNEASLLRLASAILMETDEEWQTEKSYLSMKLHTPAAKEK